MLSENRQIIDSFLDYIKYEKMYSKETLRAYKNDLNQFDKHTGNISLDALSANEIQSFLYKISKINNVFYFKS